MLNVTAVILSAQPCATQVAGVRTLNHVSQFSDAAGLLEQRIAAVHKVQTQHFFMLDDDDSLPDDYLEVLGECLAAGQPVAYTNELVIHEDGRECLHRRAPWAETDSMQRVRMLHHLVLCDTNAARRACARVPRGNYGFEPLVYGQMAQGGAAWVDRTGYIWRLRPGGMRMTLTPGMGAAVRWHNYKSGGQHGR